MAKLFAFFLIALCVSVSQCVEVTKSCTTLDNGNVEVVLTFSKSADEAISDVTFHDSLPIHAELKEGELVGILKVPQLVFFLFSHPFFFSPFSSLLLLFFIS